MELDKATILHVVHLVARHRQNGADDSVITSELQKAGVPAEGSKELLELITHGLKSGVQFAFTGGMSEPGMKPGSCDVYDTAFSVGQKSFHRAVGGVWLKRVGVVVGAIALGVLVVWLMTRL